MSQFSVTGESGEVYVVALGALGAADGAQQVYRCWDRAGRDRIYTQYGAPVSAGEVLESARRIVRIGREIVLAAERQPGSNEWAAASINWPIDVVVREQALVGVVLPAIPAEFLHTDGSALTFDHLGENTPAGYFRVGLLIRVCDIFLVLEEQGLALGGVSERNLAWSRTQPRAHLIDCDRLRPVQGEQRLGDRAGLARLMRWGLFLAHEIPADADPRLRALFEQSSSGTVQPAPGEWLTALKDVFLTPDGGAYRPEGLAGIERPTPQLGEPQPPQQPSVTPVSLSKEPEPAPVNPTWPPPTEAPLLTPFPNGSPTPPASNPGRALGILAAAAVLIAVVILIAYNTGGSHDASTASTSTTYSYSTNSYSYSPLPTTPPFNPGTLDFAGSDKTPFTADALLPDHFRDAKNVEYTRKAGGVMDCITKDMSSNVKSILNSYHCAQQVAGSYIDNSGQILVSLNVMAFATAADADNLYTTMKGQTQDWSIWCPKEGTGSTVCDGTTSYATRTGWGSMSHRYIYKSTALYINLSRNATTEWLDPAAEEAVKQAGPENYWHNK